LRLGYLDRVLGEDELEPAAQEEAKRLRTLHMPSFAATKARINEAAIRAIEAAVDEELRSSA
jgi:enoyl-CoA hydratase/carnithine racemase